METFIDLAALNQVDQGQVQTEVLSSDGLIKRFIVDDLLSKEPLPATRNEWLKKALGLTF